MGYDSPKAREVVMRNSHSHFMSNNQKKFIHKSQMYEDSRQDIIHYSFSFFFSFLKKIRIYIRERFIQIRGVKHHNTLVLGFQV